MEESEMGVERYVKQHVIVRRMEKGSRYIRI